MAGSNTAIWRDIYLANADALADAIDDAMARLAGVRAALLAGDGDAVAGWNDAARRRPPRGCSRPTSPAARWPSCACRCPNRPGVVAEVALALGRAGINIADMALHPAPDRTSGYIILWVPGPARAEAEALVAGLGLPVAPA